MVLRRANLDAFWSRERSTVRIMLLEHKRDKKIASNFQQDHLVFLPRGPFPMEDIYGAAEAIRILWRSLDPGRNTLRIQFDTVRKLRTAMSHYYHSGFNGIGDTFLSEDGTHSRDSNASTNSEWF